MPRTQTAPDPEKQLMIKTKACQRLAKEAVFYKKEARENEEKLSEMKKNGEDNIKQMEQVLEETMSMIPHSESTLRRNLEELAAMLKSNADDLASDSEWVVAANAILNENGMGISKKGDDGAGDGEPATNVDNIKEGEAF